MALQALQCTALQRLRRAITWLICNLRAYRSASMCEDRRVGIRPFNAGALWAGDWGLPGMRRRFDGGPTSARDPRVA